ncbi:TPA: hypothetical protein DIC62_01505 [Candidatus Nomurabacteria bacterium]|nr:hypothetical protein [Candidatus Nomurabacteria bacterium]
MREIKFRAWDKNSKTFITHELINGKEDAVISICGFVDLEPWQQFTGLKDKNGKEIFEGNLIAAKNYNPSVYEIKFIEGGFCATHPNLKGYPIDINHFYPSTGCEIEVIGNIYENKDLLNI